MVEEWWVGGIGGDGGWERRGWVGGRGVGGGGVG